MNKQHLISISISLLLAACAEGFSGSNGVTLGLGMGGMLGNHIGIGTSVNIPLGEQQPNRPQSSPNHHPITPSIIYFDASGNQTDAPTKGGFQRKIFTKQSNGDYLIQDFYEMGGAKRSDPMLLRSEQLTQFRANPDNGTLTIYTINGNVMQQNTYQNGKLIK